MEGLKEKVGLCSGMRQTDCVSLLGHGEDQQNVEEVGEQSIYVNLLEEDVDMDC